MTESFARPALLSVLQAALQAWGCRQEGSTVPVHAWLLVCTNVHDICLAGMHTVRRNLCQVVQHKKSIAQYLSARCSVATDPFNFALQQIHPKWHCQQAEQLQNIQWSLSASQVDDNAYLKLVVWPIH